MSTSFFNTLVAHADAAPSRRHCRAFAHAGVVALALSLGACATVPPVADKQDYPALMVEARQQVDAGETAPAIATFERAAQASPGQVEPYREIAQQYASSGSHTQAVASAGQALELDPADQVSRSIFVDSGLQVAIAVLEQLQAGGPEQVEGERPQAEALAALLAQVFGAGALLPENVRKQLAREAVEQWKRSQRKASEPRQPPVSPLDALGGG